MLICTVNQLVGETVGSAGFDLCSRSVLEGNTVVPGAVAEAIEFGIWNQTLHLD